LTGQQRYLVKKGCSSKVGGLYFLSKLVKKGCSSKVGGLYFLSKKKQNKNGDDILNKKKFSNFWHWGEA